MTVGGIISQAKKLRTKKGDTMMFATLDDLEGSVELVVFDKTLEESGEALVNDAIVLVRGRSTTRTRPGPACRPEGRAVRADRGGGRCGHRAGGGGSQGGRRAASDPPGCCRLPATALGELKDVLAGFPASPMS